MQRKPTPAELDGLIDEYIREEVLAREATAMGLADRDRVIKRRLVQRVLFLLEDVAETADPTEDELRAYVKAAEERYAEPPAVSFVHVFFSRSQRDDPAADAERTLRRLQDSSPAPEAMDSLGDPTMLDYAHVALTPSRTAMLFGRPFADTVFELIEYVCAVVFKNFGDQILAQAHD